MEQGFPEYELQSLLYKCCLRTQAQNTDAQMFCEIIMLGKERELRDPRLSPRINNIFPSYGLLRGMW